MTDDLCSEEDARRGPPIALGRTARTPRELWRRKLLWIGVWLVFLSSPVHDLVSGNHSTGGTVAGWLGLAVFVTVYLSLLFRDMGAAPYTDKLIATLIGSMAVLATVLGLTLGSAWLGLYCYVSVACGMVLPLRVAFWTIPGTGALLLLVGLRTDEEEALNLLLLVLLIGFAMTGVSQLVRTTVELRKARATVAQLAANEERLRLARDLHDLLGHSLSLITLKSELAGRMLPDHPDKAAQQVADIEQVSRQALVDVREAVTGYRRPRLAAELAGAQVALTAAGIAADPRRTGPRRRLRGHRVHARLGPARGDHQRRTPQRRRPLHGGPRAPPDPRRPRPRTLRRGRRLRWLRQGPGNGLTGLTERLEQAGGTLEADRVKHGFG